MTLALSRVRRNPHAKRANQDLPPPVSTTFLRIRQYNPRRSQKLLQGLGGYPRWVARAPPRRFDLKIKPPLERQRSNGDSGATVKGIRRGTLTNARNEITRMQVEALNSTLWSDIHTSTTVASKTEKASSESIRARARATVEYGNGLARTKRRRAQGRRPLPDARTGTRAFNAPDAFSPNTPVTGSVIGNRHPSHHPFCSLPAKRLRTCQDAGSRDGTSNQNPLETSKVNAWDNKALRGVPPSTRYVPF